jgi:DNA-binding GntR family transcriptional regulator
MDRIFKKEQRYTLVDRVLNQLREAIKSGKLKPGGRIVESELAHQMGISRITVREAIRCLEKEGLITTVPFKGAQVAELTPRDLEEIYHLRLTLEELAVRTLIKNLNTEKIEKLESVVAEMKKTAKGGTLEEIIDVDLKFHRTICELSENHRLLNSWMNLSHQLRAFIAAGDGMYGDDNPAKRLSAHYPVLEAIKNKDDHLAVELMKDVITYGYENAAQYSNFAER